MARKKYVPSKSEFRRAWLIKRKGGKKKDICKKLGITMAQYEMHTQTFNKYFAQSRLREKNRLTIMKPAKGIHKKKMPRFQNGETKLDVNEINYDLLEVYVICGFNREKIASLLGVTRSTFYTFLKKNPQVQAFMDTAKERVVGGVLKEGLLRLCGVHELDDFIHASYMGEITKEKIKRQFNPNLGAIKYLTANTLGWSSEPRPDRQNNKGAILRMLDDINNGEEHQDDVKEEKDEE